MAFPDESLDVVVEAYLADDWQDLSDRLMPETPISIRRGTSDGASMAAAGSCRVTLNDDDGALQPLGPLSPWYPHVRRGVQFRVAVRRGKDSFGRSVSNGWGTSDSGQEWATLSADPDYAVSAGVATHRHAVDGELRAVVLDTSLRNVDQVYDVASPVALTGAALVTGVMARYDGATGNHYWLRLELNSGGTTTTLKISKWVGGSLIELAELANVPGLTYAPGAPLRVRAQVAGSRLAIKAWDPDDPEPLAWMLTATDSDITEPGQTGLQSWLVSGNTNASPVTVRHSNYQALVLRAYGTASSYKPRIVPTTDGDTVSAMTIEIGGALRRLGRGTPPTRSPLRRRFGAETDGLLAYWPMEDPPDSTQAASALPDVAAMTVSGTVGFGAGDVARSRGGASRYGTMPVASIMDGGSLSGVVPAGTSSPVQWSVTAYWQSISGTGDNLVLLSWTTADGTYVRWDVVQDLGGVDGTFLRGWTAAGTASTLWSTASTFAGAAELVISAAQSGGNISISIKFAETFVDGAIVSGTLGRIGAITLNPNLVTFADDDEFVVGHLRVWDRSDLTPHPFLDIIANPGELPATRLARNAAEDRITIDMPTVAADEQMPMGVQPDGTPIALYQECANTDLGMLFEPCEDIDLRYLPRARRYSQTPSLIVDLATYQTPSGTSGNVLQPVYDDQGLRNTITVSRRDGSQFTAIDWESVDADGEYVDAPEFNVRTDGALPDIADWLEHLGTVDEVRNPAFTIDLSGNPDLIDQWLSTDIGHRVQRTNVPAKRGGGTIDQMLDGSTETLGHRSWSISANCSPASPWDVARVEDPVLGRADTDGTVLAASYAAGTATTLTVSVTAGPAWIQTSTHGSMFPFDAKISGVRVRVTGISGTTWTVDQAPVNGIKKTCPAGSPVLLWTPWVAAL